MITSYAKKKRPGRPKRTMKEKIISIMKDGEIRRPVDLKRQLGVSGFSHICLALEHGPFWRVYKEVRGRAGFAQWIYWPGSNRPANARTVILKRSAPQRLWMR